MADPQHSFIPVARKRLSLQSPLNVSTISSISGPSSPSRKPGHRRNKSTASSGDESSASRTASRGHARTASSGHGHARTPSVGGHARTPSVGGLSRAGSIGHNRTSSRVSMSNTHSRLSSAVSGRPESMSPHSALRSLATSPTGIDSEEDLSASIDRVRAPTRSSLNKQRKSLSLSVGHEPRAPSTPLATPRAENDKLGLTRIPRAAVANAVSLHASINHAGLSPPVDNSLELADGMTPSPRTELGSPLATTAALSPSPEIPMREPLAPMAGPQSSRIPSGPHGKSSRMIATLQTDLEHTKGHLDRVKQEVRNCRREIGTLTRRSEDLRETRDRMRSEAETLQNVIARKERMVAEVLARARTAEAAVAQHTTDRKEFESRAKKSVADAAAEVEAANAARTKAESECDALRDSIRSLREAWTREVEGYRAEVAKVQTQMQEQREAAAQKQDAIMKLLRDQSDEHKNIVHLVDEVNAKSKAAHDAFDAEVRSLRSDVERSNLDAEKARETAKTLASELARLRRYAKQAPRDDLDAVAAGHLDALTGASGLAQPELPIDGQVEPQAE